MRRRSAPPPSGQQMIREYLGRVSVAATKVLPKGDRLLFVGRTRAAIEAQVGPLASADADHVRNALLALGEPEALAKRERERLYSARRRGAAAAPPALWKPAKEPRRGAVTPAPPPRRPGPGQARRSRSWPHRGMTGPEEPPPAQAASPAESASPAQAAPPAAPPAPAVPRQADSPEAMPRPAETPAPETPAPGTPALEAPAPGTPPTEARDAEALAEGAPAAGSPAAGSPLGEEAAAGAALADVPPAGGPPAGPATPEESAPVPPADVPVPEEPAAGVPQADLPAPEGPAAGVPPAPVPTPGEPAAGGPGADHGDPGLNGRDPGGTPPGWMRPRSAPPPGETTPLSIVPGMGQPAEADEPAPARRRPAAAVPLAEAWALARKHPLEAVAVVLLGVGGLILPFPFWLIGGLVSLKSRRWDARDKWVALAGPPLVTLAVLIIRAATSPGNFFSAFYHAARHDAGLSIRAGCVLCAVYLVCRLRRGPRLRTLPPWQRPR